MIRGVIATKNRTFIPIIKNIGKLIENSTQARLDFSLNFYSLIFLAFYILLALLSLFNLLFLTMKVKIGSREIKENRII